MRKTTRRHRRTKAEWTKLVEEWRRSGLSSDEYAKQHNLGRLNLLKWAARLAPDRRKDGDPHNQGRNPTRFIPLQLASEGQTRRQEQLQGSIELELPDGCLVRVRGEVSSAVLAKVLAAVQGPKSC
jgi:hypothetical protein